MLPGSGGNGPGGGFKNNLMMGPGGPHPTPQSDPNYAQQFHSFQQQLYATNTRNNQMGQNNGPPPGSIGPQGRQYKKFKITRDFIVNISRLKLSSSYLLHG